MVDGRAQEFEEAAKHRVIDQKSFGEINLTGTRS
jgi:hypothetical protein